MHTPRWCLFYDVHTMPACPDVGANFDADAFADRIKGCGVDYVVFHARCNLGMAYYNTKAGIRHPSLKYDLFGRFTAACVARGIAVGAYFNVGLSHEEALRHRDWTVLTPEGYTYKPDRLDHFFRMMCYNTGYAGHLLEMVREVLGGYPVSGLFFDCMGQPPCVGVECIREMKECGIDWTDGVQLARFANFSRVRMARRLAEAAQSIKPDLLIYYNGVAYEDQLDCGTYIEYECLPTGGWGYESLPMYGRYLRTLGKPLLNMTGRFHRSWGDFGGIRTESSLEYDLRHGLALGMRSTIGDHFHPRGDINPAVFDLIERVYTRLQKLDPWLDGAVPVAEIGVVASKSVFGDYQIHEKDSEQTHPAVKGATRLLCELKQQFDIVPETASWSQYRLLILPDHVCLDEAAARKIQAHLDRGGTVLSSGWSGLDPAMKDFALPAWGLKYAGNDPFDPAYIVPGSLLRAGMPDMPLTLYERGASVEAMAGIGVLARICAPYYNRHWDGEHGFLYLPPDRTTERPAVTQSGNVVHISHPVFTAYLKHAPVPMRQLVANILELLLPKPLLRVPSLPSFARATVTAQPGRRMVHLLSYVPERRGPNIDMIEEPIELHQVPVSLRVDDHRPRRVYLAPHQADLAFDIRDGYVTATVPVIPGHAMVVFEED